MILPPDPKGAGSASIDEGGRSTARTARWEQWRSTAARLVRMDGWQSRQTVLHSPRCLRSASPSRPGKATAIHAAAMTMGTQGCAEAKYERQDDGSGGSNISKCVLRYLSIFSEAAQTFGRREEFAIEQIVKAPGALATGKPSLELELETRRTSQSPRCVLCNFSRNRQVDRPVDPYSNNERNQP